MNLILAGDFRNRQLATQCFKSHQLLNLLSYDFFMIRPFLFLIYRPFHTNASCPVFGEKCKA